MRKIAFAFFSFVFIMALIGAGAWLWQFTQISGINADLTKIAEKPATGISQLSKPVVTKHLSEAMPNNSELTAVSSTFKALEGNLATVDIKAVINGKPATYFAMLSNEDNRWKVTATVPRPGSLGAGLNQSGVVEAFPSAGPSNHPPELPAAAAVKGAASPVPTLKHSQALNKNVIRTGNGKLIPVLLVTSSTDDSSPLDGAGGANAQTLSSVLSARPFTLVSKVKIDNPTRWKEQISSVQNAISELENTSKSKVFIVTDGLGELVARSALPTVAGKVHSLFAAPASLVSTQSDLLIPLLSGACQNSVERSCAAINEAIHITKSSYESLPPVPASVALKRASIQTTIHAPRVGWFAWAPPSDRIFRPIGQDPKIKAEISCVITVQPDSINVLLDTGEGLKSPAQTTSACLNPLATSYVAKPLLDDIDKAIAAYTTLTPENLLTAPLPAACGLPQAAMEGGKHPQATAGSQYELSNGGKLAVFGNVTGLGQGSAVAQANCKGANGQQQNLLIGWAPGPRLIAFTEINSLGLDIPSAIITSLQINGINSVVATVSSSDATVLKKGSFTAIVEDIGWKITNISTTDPADGARTLAPQIISNINARNLGNIASVLTPQAYNQLLALSDFEYTINKFGATQASLGECRPGADQSGKANGTVVCAANKAGQPGFDKAAYWMTFAQYQGNIWLVQKFDSGYL